MLPYVAHKVTCFFCFRIDVGGTGKILESECDHSENSEVDHSLSS